MTSASRALPDGEAQPVDREEAQPLVSIVLPTLNAVVLIKDCINSLNNQSYPSIEIIGVDAESTDGTAEIMARYTRFFTFKLEPTMPWGTPYQVVWGASQARGQFLYFVDSDMVLLPEAVETYAREIDEQGADALIVPEISFGEGFWAACKTLERSSYLLGDSSIEAPRFIRKSVWDRVGGYDPSMGGILDWDFHKRLRDQGAKIIRGSIPVYHNEGRLTLKKLIRKKYTYGKTTGTYLSKHWKDKDVVISQFNPLRPVFFRNWKAFIRDPIHTTGFIVMKLVEGTAWATAFVVNSVFPRKNG